MEIKYLAVGPYGTNCYFLCDKEAGVCAVIDPGGSPDQILAVLEKLACRPCAILLTHGHYDHTGAVADLLERFPGIRVSIHRGDFQNVDTKLFPLSRQVPEEAVSFYDEGDTVTVGAMPVEVLHTPGHSPGSVTLKVEDVLFTGDTLFAGSCGRTDLRGGSYEQIMQSLKRLGELKGDFHVCPGHEATSTLERERRSNPFLMEAMRS